MTKHAIGPDAQDHELLRAFDKRGCPLNGVLREMLNEHHTHRTERRGCGYTQATRHLAEYVNYPGRVNEYDDARLFADKSPGVIPRLRARAEELGVRFDWRNLDRNRPDPALLEDPEFSELFQVELSRQRQIREMPEQLELEESVLLARIIRDIVLPVTLADVGAAELPLWQEPLKIGTCPLAEKYFLELADGFVRRRGRMNIICADDGRPLLIEKLHLGDDHSCISLEPLVLNGVCLPAGSLFGVQYESLFGTQENAELPGLNIPLRACSGFRFLRLTTLSVSCDSRPRAFSKHFRAQVDGGLFDPGVVEISQLLSVAQAQIPKRRDSATHLHVVYSEKMVGDPWRAAAPGPLKALQVIRSLNSSGLPIQIVPPVPASVEDLYRTHERSYVDDVLACRRNSAFGTRSDELARSLPYTCGAVYTAALLALDHGISASLTCGFHHAHYDQPRSYCTFNGLVVAAQRLLSERRVRHILILDCDYHHGDGTDALIERHQLAEHVHNESLGARFSRPDQADEYIDELRSLGALMDRIRPDIILYQAGVDVHLDDPLGGMLTTDEMQVRDRLVFSQARTRGIPVTWNLAGGYQVDGDGSYNRMVELHLDTFRAAVETFLPHGVAAVVAHTAPSAAANC